MALTQVISGVLQDLIWWAWGSVGDGSSVGTPPLSSFVSSFLSSAFDFGTTVNYFSCDVATTISRANRGMGSTGGFEREVLDERGIFAYIKEIQQYNLNEWQDLKAVHELMFLY